ncbi:NAD(P)/FAD-dependent oxidoreductase [Nonomuraea ferruginea]
MSPPSTPSAGSSPWPTAGGELGYDTLLYALGSHVAGGVPGVAEHAFDVTGRASALRLRERLDGLERRGEGGNVLVVGDGLTGIETATELAESRPGLSVTLVAREQLGARLSDGARGHLRQACDRLGITVLEHTGVEAVEAARVLCAGGTALTSDATVWTAGFAVGPIAAAAGLEVTEAGRIVVDRTMRSVSHPDVYAMPATASTPSARTACRCRCRAPRPVSRASRRSRRSSGG